jgi:subtilisin family serine protease
VTSRFPVGVLACALAALSASSAAAPAVAAPGPRDGSPDRVVVAFGHHADAADREGALRDAHATRAQILPGLDGTTAMTVADGSAAAAASALNDDDAVAWAQVDVRASAAVALPFTGVLQWGLANFGQLIFQGRGTAGVDGHFPAAWDLSTGRAATPIAVVDTGVDFSIADLAANRVAGGHDFVANDDDPSPAPPAGADPGVTSHGTHVAGIAAASLADAQGSDDITGAAPDAGIMALRALDATGLGWSSDIAAAFAWAADHGARVVNASLTTSTPSQAMADAIAAHPNTLFVVAAGNEGSDEDAGSGAHRDYPCAFDLPNVICVAAVDNRGALASFSNYGATSVDLAAPGVDVVSYTAGGQLAWWDGTSMAAPYVAAAAELALAHTPTLTAPQLHDAIIQSAQPLSALASRTSSGGMIDAADLVARTAALPLAAAPVAPAAPAAPVDASPPPATPLTRQPPAVPAPAPIAAPSTPKPRASQLELQRVSRSGSRLRVSGRLARAWRGAVTVKACAGGRCTRVRAQVRQGRFTARMSAVRGRRLKVTVAAPPTRGYAAARVTRTASA